MTDIVPPPTIDTLMADVIAQRRAGATLRAIRDYLDDEGCRPLPSVATIHRRLKRPCPPENRAPRRSRLDTRAREIAALARAGATPPEIHRWLRFDAGLRVDVATVLRWLARHADAAIPDPETPFDAPAVAVDRHARSRAHHPGIHRESVIVARGLAPEVWTMRRAGCSVPRILDFLAERGVVVHHTTLRHYLASHPAPPAAP